MSMNPDDPTGHTAREKLAAAVAQRKAAQQAGRGGIPGQRQSERAAAARSLSRSKPALRK